jgi:hypothetical protein
MSKKNLLIFISLIFVFLFVVVLFFPWKKEGVSFREDCNEYCESIKNELIYGLECKLPLGGCFRGCVGLEVDKRCSQSYKCFDRCESICFGLDVSSCGPSVFERKINYFIDKIRE